MKHTHRSHARSSRLGWMLGCTLVCGSSVASAQQATSTTSEADTARDQFDRGVRALDEGRFGDAVAAFNDSYNRRPAAVVLYNLGLALRGVGHETQAIEAFQQYLASPPLEAPAATPEAVQQDHVRRDRARDELARLQRRQVTLEVRNLPADATVFVDGRSLRTDSPGHYSMDPGVHILEVRSAGGAGTRQEVTAPAGAQVQFDAQSLGGSSAAPASSSTRQISVLVPVGTAVTVVSALAGLALAQSANGVASRFAMECGGVTSSVCLTRASEVQSDLSARNTGATITWVTSLVGGVLAGVGLGLSFASPAPSRSAQNGRNQPIRVSGWITPSDATLMVVF